MKHLGSREFLRGSLPAAGTLALGFPRSSKAADPRVEILVGEPVADITIVFNFAPASVTSLQLNLL